MEIDELVNSVTARIVLYIRGVYEFTPEQSIEYASTDYPQL